MDKKKLTTYLTLLIGLIVIMIVFFLERKGFGFKTNFNRTKFEDVFNGGTLGFIFGRGGPEMMWWLLLGSFTFSWWRLRGCIANVLLKLHKGI